MSENKDTENIRQFWNDNPVGSNFVDYRQDTSFYLKYDEFRYRTEGHILAELDQLDLAGKKTLEIGLGQGADSMQLIDRGALYYGIDLTEESVRRVKERFQLFDRKYCEVKVANAEHLPYADSSFDIVYSHGVIHHSPAIAGIVSEIHRVLKPGGQAVIMLYHKNSFNYYVSIGLLRRMGLLLIRILPTLAKPVSKLTGESVDRINRHKYHLRQEGMSYFRLKNFLHRSTDGPDNVYSSVWNKRSSEKLFGAFSKVATNVHFLNERHLMGVQYLLPRRFKRWLGHTYGWHIWIKAIK
jgi:ubiquinone/menaquinone biosynthesis C-methylase UbiE